MASECVDGRKRRGFAVLSRVDDLRKVPAAVRFLSCEPLIGSLPDIDLTDIHWVIVGGESGWGARPVKFEWIVAA